MRPIVIAAGGTGGHFFPAEALAGELVARGHRIALMTDKRSPGQRSAVFEGRERHVISGAGLAGRGVRAASAAMSLAAGVFQARTILARIDASVIVGFGGYPCVAPVLGAQLLRGCPAIVLHEQNAVLGRANRFLSGRADRLALSFEHTSRVPPGVLTRVTGNPVRPSITTAAYLPPDAEMRVLVLGGSLGARVFSDLVPTAIAELPATIRARVRVVQQCRTEDLERVREAYAASGVPAELSAFFPDVADRLAAAHLVLARAGASTVAELAVAGRPSILVPLPGAIDDHQSDNARALADAGGAWVMPQASLSPQLLGFQIASLLGDAAALAQAGEAARSQARPQAAASLADIVEEYALGKVRA